LSSAAPLVSWLAFQDSQSSTINSKLHRPRSRLQRMVSALEALRQHTKDNDLEL